MNRVDVKNAILGLLEATQDPDYVEKVDFWMDLGLSDVYSACRAWWSVRAAMFTVEEDGVIYLPPSYLEMRGVVPQNGTEPLRPMSIEQAAPYLWLNGADCSVVGYLMEGRTLTLLPQQNKDFVARCSYYSKLEPLVADDDTSLYLEYAASAIMYAGASHGAVYRGDLGLAGTFAQSAVARVEAINAESQGGLYGTGIVMNRSRK